MGISEEFEIVYKRFQKSRLIFTQQRKKNISKNDQDGPGFEPQTQGTVVKQGSPFKIPIQENVKINSKMVRTL